MNAKKELIIFGFITGIVLIFFILLAVYITKPDIYTGTDLTFEVSSMFQNFTINSEYDVTFEAGSVEFYVLRDLQGNVIYGKMEKPALGSSGKYFYTSLQSIPAGKWNVEKGGCTIHLTSSQNVTAKVDHVIWLKVLVYISFIIAYLSVWYGLVLIPFQKHLKKIREIEDRIKNQ